MNEFWTVDKLGKHKQLAGQAERLYEHYALCNADKLLARLLESKFNFGNYGPCKWSEILQAANLDDCLKSEYVNEALKITSARPAIGKGEFLFVSIFSNVGFARDSGDLIDLRDNAKVEVKGIDGKLGNGQSHKFRALTPDTLYALYVALQHTPIQHDLDATTCESLKRMIGADENLMRKTFEILQNTKTNDLIVVNEAIELYKNTKHLLRTIAAMHLYAYLKIQTVKYFIAVNDKQFRCFNAPTNLASAYNILSKFTVDYWKIGETGVSITLD